MGLLLPIHIIEVIFSKLPISNLPTCRLVCRAWNDLVLNFKTLISDGSHVFTINFDLNLILKSSYSKMHCMDTNTLSCVASFEFEIDDLKRISIHSSCNGLLFILKINKKYRCGGILNPMTNQFFEVPKIEGTYRFFGFGFSPKTKKYKLFRIRIEIETSRGKLEVFRFGTHKHEWSLIHSNLPPFTIQGKSVYLNGVIYWITRMKKRIDECIIYTLDVETEKIESNVVLKLGCAFPMSMKIRPFNGTVYVVVCIFESSVTIQAWRMQGKDSWIKDFVIDDIEDGSSIAKSFNLINSFHMIKAFEDGGILVRIKNVYYCLDRMGRKMRVKTLDPNARLVDDIFHMSSFNFCSLPNILGEHE